MTKKSSASANFESLFGAKSGERLASGLKLIPRELIHPGDQPRRSFPKEELAELAQSMMELKDRREGIEGTGLLQPLLVYAEGSSYRLIAGERRWRASEIAKLDKLPAIVVPQPAQGVLLAQLIENLQRRELPPLEEAQAIEKMMREQKLSIRNAAILLGKGKGYVEDRLRLLKMAPDVQELVSGRPDTLTHAREIDGVDDPDFRIELIRAVQNEGISVAEVRRRVASTLHPQPEKLTEETIKTIPPAATNDYGVGITNSLDKNPTVSARTTTLGGNSVQESESMEILSGRPDKPQDQEDRPDSATTLAPSTFSPDSPKKYTVSRCLEPALELLNKELEVLSSTSLSTSELQAARRHVKQLQATVAQINQLLSHGAPKQVNKKT